MRSDELTPEQIAELQRVLGPTTGYLTRVVQRMEKIGFPVDDMLYRHAVEAQHRMPGLCMELHYLGCRNGVGRKSTPDTSAFDQ